MSSESKPRRGSNLHFRVLGNHLVRGHRAIDPAGRALNGVIHGPPDRFNVKGILLSAFAKDFNRYHIMKFFGFTKQPDS